MIELLSPVGDFDCLKAAVQFGANAVYFGGDIFNARSFATNFSKSDLAEAIQYAKLRNVKVNFTLNTLIKDSEFAEAINLVNYVYALGADSIIVQDLGLATYLIKYFPDLPIHGSTQMTVHNLDGALALQDLGFQRVVLSRELTLKEIEYICHNSNIEIETFIHGALCISYSGQCLFSSTIGARSGNRGKCAQPCRLPYALVSKEYEKSQERVLDRGYLLSPRDLCGLKYIPALIEAGVKSLKIEGRMKSPTYVATVTEIYRKYIDLAYSDKPYVINKEDIAELMQAFNRGGFSYGNYPEDPNLNYVYKIKPNNMGLYAGKVTNYNFKKGLITFETNQKLELGDKVSLENENNSYTISELIKNNKNIECAVAGDFIKIGRVKGNIHCGDKIYKLASKAKDKFISNSLNKEIIKMPLNAQITIQRNSPITLTVFSGDNFSSTQTSNIVPVEALNHPITVGKIKQQLSKTNDTPFEFEHIDVKLDDNLYISQISAINALRRDCLNDIKVQIVNSFSRKPKKLKMDIVSSCQNSKVSKPKVSLLLNKLDVSYDYDELDEVDNIYIPLKYFFDKKYYKVLEQLSSKSRVLIYLPAVLRENYSVIVLSKIKLLIKKFNINGIVISNISSLVSFKDLIDEYCYGSSRSLYDFDIVSNIGLNIFNNRTISQLKKLGVTRVTLSPELDKNTLQKLSDNSPLLTELVVYGKLPLMNLGYCLLGKSNKCYSSCKMKCKDNSKIFLKDRLNMKFRVLTDNSQTLSTIFNSKTTSVDYSYVSPNYVRVSIIDEDISTINNIIKNVKSNISFSGEDYTKGNWNKIV